MSERDTFEKLYNHFEITRSDDYARLTGEEFGKRLAEDAIKKLEEKINPDKGKTKYQRIRKFIDGKPNRDYDPYNQTPDMRTCFPKAGAKMNKEKTPPFD